MTEQMPLFQDGNIEDVEEDIVSLSPLTAFPRSHESAPSAIRKAWFKNMKVFRDFSIELADFNVLVGPNNCGKSTILQAIDLCFRLISMHVEFRGGALAKPRQGRRLLEAMLPVATPGDFWYGGIMRAGKNTRIEVLLGLELVNGMQFEFEIRSLWGGLNSRMTKFPEGAPEIEIRAIISRRPTLIPFSVGVVSLEEYRSPARLELLSATGHRNEVLRNFIRELSRKNPEGLGRLKADLQKHFGATINPIAFEMDLDQYLDVKYQEGTVQHDIFSVGGGFLQVLQLLTYLYLETPGVVMLDEPDAHLHSSMQRLVVDILAATNKKQRIQVIMATHSKEIINYVDPMHIIPLTRDAKVARSLEKHASVLPILKDMGAIDNVDLAALVGSHKCGFVEGDSDKKVFAKIAAKLGSTVFEGASQVVLVTTEGVENPEKVVSLSLLEQIIGHRLGTLIIRDRDGLPPELVSEIVSKAKEKGRNVIVLTRTHIENYLIAPTAIHRVLVEEMNKRNNKDFAIPSLEEVTNDILAELDTLHTSAFDNSSVHIQQHYVAYRDRHIDAKSTNEVARAYCEPSWSTVEGKIELVEGKKAIRAIRSSLQKKYSASFSDMRIIEAMERDEIPAEIRDIIRQLEELRVPG